MEVQAMNIRYAIIPWFDTESHLWRETLKIFSDKHDGTLATIHHWRRDGKITIEPDPRVEMVAEAVEPTVTNSVAHISITFTPPPTFAERFGTLPKKGRRPQPKASTMEDFF
jgi:hypothetical protein